VFFESAEGTSALTWFIDSVNGTDGAGYGLGRGASALASLAYLMTNATTLGLGAYDTVYLMPAHAEAFAAAADCTLATAGMRLIGLGHGSLIPTFTLGTDPGATLDVSATNVLVKNIKIISDLADVTAGITAAATADGLTVEDCIFTDGALAKELVIGISFAALLDGAVVRNCQFYTDVSAETGGCASCVSFVGGSIRSLIEGCVAHGHYTVACIDNSAAAATQLVIRNNALANIDTGAGLSIALHANTTGVVAWNVATAAKNGTHPVVAAAAHIGETYGSDEPGKNAIMSPTIATI
jgi:hypothetical protein